MLAFSGLRKLPRKDILFDKVTCGLRPPDGPGRRKGMLRWRDRPRPPHLRPRRARLPRPGPCRGPRLVLGPQGQIWRVLLWRGGVAAAPRVAPPPPPPGGRPCPRPPPPPPGPRG